MTRTGKFITADELEALRVHVSTSGMFLTGGRPMGDPGAFVEDMNKKYGLTGHAVDPKNGEFVEP